MAYKCGRIGFCIPSLPFGIVYLYQTLSICPGGLLGIAFLDFVLALMR